METNPNIIEKELHGETVKIDKRDGLPVSDFGRRKPKDNPECAPDLPVKEPKPRAVKVKILKPPETLAEQVKIEAAQTDTP